MKLELAYLKARHEYWKQRIGEAGIWNPGFFQDVEIKIRKNHRRYNALFQRKITYIRSENKNKASYWTEFWRKKNREADSDGLNKERGKGGQTGRDRSFDKGKAEERRIVDRIVVYNKVEDFDPFFLDSILVHEMIHQYTVQNEIKDSSVHGRVFRKFMENINARFPGELKIQIKDLNPGLPVKGEGETKHDLLLVHFTNATFMAAVIMKDKTYDIEKLIKRNKKRWSVKSWERAVSNDIFFSRFVRCKSSLHGLIKSESEFEVFKETYHINILS